MTYSAGLVKCSAEDCEATHPNHRWGNIKAQSAGWFAQMDGSRWCPDHTPEWVESWRKSKENHEDRGR